MIDLTSFLHREHFHNCLARWLADEITPSDPADVKRIVNLNAVVIKRYLCPFANSMIRAVYGLDPHSFPFHDKGAMKDFATNHPATTNARIEEMISRYRARPEDYYRETPVDGRVYHAANGAGPVFLGVARFKRYRRIAEKASAAHLGLRLPAHSRDAEYRASQRAREMNLPLEHMVSTPDQMLRNSQRRRRASGKA